MNIKSLIAKIGTNPYFIAFNAHCWFAFAFMAFTFQLDSVFRWIIFGLGIIIAGIKEFWFDANYETPKQTFVDNGTDFLGYLSGLLLGAWWFGLF